MPQPRLDDANIEFDFTAEEIITARMLGPLAVAWLQTKYAKYWKVRNSTPASEHADTDRSYFLKIAEIDGKLSMIQELLDDHKNALKEMAELAATGNQKSGSEQAVAERAANLVHRIQT